MRFFLKKLKDFYKGGLAPYEARGFRSGFVMLFSAVISSIILAIALGVMNIALKELAFDTSAKNTNDAFFAADTAAECALYYDLAVGDTSAFGVPSAGLSVSCAGTDLDLNNGNNAPSSGPYYFSLYPLSPSGSACANVTVSKTTDPESTTILARGYNLGGNTVDCTSSNQNRVERELLVTIGEGPAIVPPESFTLTVNASGPGVVTSSLFGINCGNGNTNCQASYNAGTPIILTATPDAGYEVAWSGGSCSGSSSTCSFTMDVNRTVNATFSIIQHNVTVALAGPSGAGSVTSSPAGIGCSPICGTSFNAGQNVQLTASANGGYQFTGWSGASAGECSGNTCNFNNLSADKSVQANFAYLYPQVASEITSIDVGPDTSHTVSLPTGIQSGDLLVTFFSLDAFIPVNWPSGWTSLVAGGVGSNRVEVAYKIADGTETGTMTVTTTPAQQQPSAHHTVRITNFNIANPIAASTVSATLNPNALNPGAWDQEYTLWFAVNGRNNGSNSTTTGYPAGYSVGTTVHAPPADTNGTTIATARREAFVISEDPSAFTIGGPGPASSTHSVTIGIQGL